MDLGNIIGILIILIYIASVIFKKRRRIAKANKKAAAETSSGWKEKLTKLNSLLQDKFGDFINEIKQEIEAAEQKKAKKDTGWEKFLPPKPAKKAAPVFAVDETEEVSVAAAPMPKDLETDVVPRDVEAMPQDVFQQKMAQPPKTRPAFKPRPPTKKAADEKKEPAIFQKEKPEKILAFGIRDLKRAVIWSEILAPPVALRRQGIFRPTDEQQ